MNAYKLVKEAKKSFNEAEQLRVKIMKDVDEFVNKENHLYMTICRMEAELKNYKHKHEHK